jgi:hypothetical protein
MKNTTILTLYLRMENNTIPGRIALELDYNVGYCKMIKL